MSTFTVIFASVIFIAPILTAILVMMYYPHENAEEKKKDSILDGKFPKDRYSEYDYNKYTEEKLKEEVENYKKKSRKIKESLIKE